MRAAGIRKIGDSVGLVDLPEPRALRADEVLLDVRACGVGNWDEFVRAGGWDTGARPPMAMGVEAAGLVAAVGDAVDGLRPGDPVTTHSLPLREQGCWAEQFIPGRAGADPARPAARPGRDHRGRRRAVSPGPGGRGHGPDPAGHPRHGRGAPAR